MRGRHPKPLALRQNRTKKASRATISVLASASVPEIPNPDGRTWHALTLAAWSHAWMSPMASEWLETDTDALGRVALLWDQFYLTPGARLLSEIRLQESRFGFSPMDRARLQWTVNRTDDGAERKRRATPDRKPTGVDPRKFLRMVGDRTEKA